MPYLTPLPTDILNIVFDYANISKEYQYYKQRKKSKQGYKNIKLNYHCKMCNRKIRNYKDAIYGFPLYHYKYYESDIPLVLIGNKTLSRFYHYKKHNNEYYENIRNVQGNITESPSAINITMLNINDGKILGNKIIKTINYIDKSYTKLKKCEKMFRGLDIDFVHKIPAQSNIYDKTISYIVNNNKDLEIGHHCISCKIDERIYKFIKL